MKKLSLLLLVVLAAILIAGCKPDPDATYSVIYNGNDQTSGWPPNDNRQYKSGEEATVLGNINDLVKTGYEFLRWNTKSDGTGASYSAGDTITIKGDVFLYAIWVVLP